MTTAQPTTYRLRSDVRFRIVAGEAVILRQSDAEVLTLNRVGSRMLELLAGGEDSDQVGAKIAKEFGADPREVRDDLQEFVQELEQGGVLHRADNVEDDS